MALGWMTALKLVPWGEVIEATPRLVKGARQLFGQSRPPPAPPRAPATPVSAGGATGDRDAMAAQVEALQGQVAALQAEQRDAAALVATLAEQHAQVVVAVDALRQRAHRLGLAAGVLAAAVLALAGWIATH